MQHPITDSACVHLFCTFPYGKGKKTYILCCLYYGVIYCFSCTSKTKSWLVG